MRLKKNTAPIRKKRPAAEKFDPFNDRLSRDIRNTLSEAFINSIVRMEKSEYREAIKKWLTEKPADIYRIYIQNRLLRYDRVIEQINATKLNNSLLQFIVIWNNDLFFEVHDHLERIWSVAAGDQRQALKGLIKAAGVYIHLEHHRQTAAASLSAKSLDIIRKHAHRLSFIANLDVLVEKLKTLDPVPPRLEIAGLRED